MPRDRPTFLTLPVELRLEIYTYLLVLPPPPPRETLQATYRCSYAASPSGSSLTTTNSKPTLYPQILRVNTQTYYEALPVLYGQNTFSAHPVRLTAQPTLYHPYCTPCRPVATILGTNFAPTAISGERKPALSTTNPNTHLIKKWHLRLRLDPPPATNQPSQSHNTTTNNNNNENDATRTVPAGLGASFSHADVLTLDLWRGLPAARTPNANTNTTNGNNNTNGDTDGGTTTNIVDIGVHTLLAVRAGRKKSQSWKISGNACCRDACHSNGLLVFGNGRLPVYRVDR
ncbi:predicted protein [Chaetomium globosum CBS 148.51]|uniref:F-box domain-containing protein n=1 Tax=Chaetomium globosum (strain ATCC 6205 / CBS 148.51 / DSM 1962 / NBRC 6347 / NRRL 1970) TaxID=306901 RepID=Q2HAT1_CHAGB|nr:uncharacterized protein CHGG_02673 [Chaetomium globosum CBS 148.51]EAQ90738.1 predicted protein [Chaetomium globosum CBS 148.51]